MSLTHASLSAVFILVVVQELKNADMRPDRLLSDYTLEELKNATNKYSTERGKRQASSDRVYIAANITESGLNGGFRLGDGMVYGGYTNHPLKAGVYYNIGLRSQVSGTNTPLYAVVMEPISKYI